MDNSGCEKCGNYSRAVPVELGHRSVYATLCPSCLTAWDEHSEDHPALRSAERINTVLSMAERMTQADGLDRTKVVLGLLEQQRSLRVVIRQLYRDWVAPALDPA